jgi:hypothetical protein
MLRKNPEKNVSLIANESAKDTGKNVSAINCTGKCCISIS